MNSDQILHVHLGNFSGDVGGVIAVVFLALAFLGLFAHRLPPRRRRDGPRDPEI